jgi:hypothetical protein
VRTMDFQSLARSSMRVPGSKREEGSSLATWFVTAGFQPSSARLQSIHRIATASNINNGQPDPAAVRMIPDLYDPTDDDPLCPDSLRTLCRHSPRTLPLQGACHRHWAHPRDDSVLARCA